MKSRMWRAFNRGLLPLMAAAALSVPACSAKNSAPAIHLENFSLTGGSTQSEQKAAETAYDAGAASPRETDVAYQHTVRRRLVKRADLRVRVENLDEADASINSLMEKYDAYAAYITEEENSRSYNIRVPADAYNDFLAAMDGMGRALYRTESAEDVTLRYYDLEGRLATQQELLRTFRSYLGKAKNIEEILSVEARIAELQGEIDRTGQEFRVLADLVDYATIVLAIHGPVTAMPSRGATLSERIKELFGGFGKFLSTAALVLTGIVIYGIPIVLLFTLLFWLLLGRIGILKKLLRAAAGNAPPSAVHKRRENQKETILTDTEKINN